MTYTCANCSVEFEAERVRRAAPVCSLRCRNEHRRRQSGALPRYEYKTTGMKTCSKCMVSKPVSQFTKRKDREGTPISVCKPCNAVVARTWARSPAGRAAYYARKYGVTMEWVTKTLERQGNACAICRTEVKLHLDHDHVTGEARGFLCHGCNVGLGQFADDAKRLKAAVNYLQGATVRA